jgi:hypothetical protein
MNSFHFIDESNTYKPFHNDRNSPTVHVNNNPKDIEDQTNLEAEDIEIGESRKHCLVSKKQFLYRKDQLKKRKSWIEKAARKYFFLILKIFASLNSFNKRKYIYFSKLDLV